MISEEKLKNGQRWKKRLWRYGPLVFWLGFIFFASTGEMSASNTSRIIGPLFKRLFPDISETTLASIHIIVRKCAHFTEYAILAFLAARSFAFSSIGMLRKRWFVCALILVIAVAFADEYHQSFVASRTGSIYDSMIDCVGGLSMLLIFRIWLKSKAEA